MADRHPAPAQEKFLTRDDVNRVAVAEADEASLLAEWGGITGALSDQADLIAALTAKLDDSQAGAFGLDLLALANLAAAKVLLAYTKGDIGLGNVENKSSATIRSEITSGNVTTALGFTPYNATNPSGYISGNQTITFSGDATGSGAIAVALTVTKINGISLAGLATGILKNMTGTGAPSIAAAADFPTLNQNTTGSAGTLATSRNFSISGGGITAAAIGFDGSAAVVLSASVDAGHITLARMANVASATVFYRRTAGTGAPETQTLATLKTDLGLTGTNSGDQTTIVGITGTKAQFNTAATDGDFVFTDAIGVSVQAYDADLATIAGLTATTDNFIVSVAGAWASRTPAQVRTTLGLATVATSGSAADLSAGTLLAARMPALTGDVTTSAGAVAAALATVNSDVGSFGSATQVATFTVNAKGLTTAASNVTITPAVGSITGLGTGVSTFLATPSSANLLAALTTKTGTGSAVFSISPTFTGTVGGAAATFTGDVAGASLIGSGGGVFKGVAPTTGTGVFIEYTGSAAFITAYDYGTPTTKPLTLWSSKLSFLGSLSNFASDAAAAAGGVAVNQVYRNGSIVMIRVV